MFIYLILLIFLIRVKGQLRDIIEINNIFFEVTVTENNRVNFPDNITEKKYRVNFPGIVTEKERRINFPKPEETIRARKIRSVKLLSYYVPIRYILKIFTDVDIKNRVFNKK